LIQFQFIIPLSNGGRLTFLTPGAGGSQQARAPGEPDLSTVGGMQHTEVDQRATLELANKLNEGKAATINQYVNAGLSSPKILQTLNILEAASKIGGKDVFREPGSSFAMQAAQFLKDRGWADNTKTLAALPYAELITKLNAELASQATHAITSRGTDFDMVTFMRNITQASPSHSKEWRC
jgi:hypothetical protein